MEIDQVFCVRSRATPRVRGDASNHGSWRKNVVNSNKNIWLSSCYDMIFMPPPLGAGDIMFSGCPSVRLSVRPSVRPKPKIPSFDLYMGPLVHPTNRNRFTACPSVRLSVRPSGKVSGYLPENAWGIGLKFYMLMYLDHLQNWLVYGRGLLIFLILALFWLSETGQIWGFRAFPGERMEGMAWNFASWCTLTTFRTEKFMATVCWFLLILALFWLSETGQIWGFRAYPGERMEGMAWNMICCCILTTFRTD